jgi:hypothetical protein
VGGSGKQGFPSFLHTPARIILSFASQKRTLAFYSATQNAPFGVIQAENAYSEKVCKSVPAFCNNSGKGVSGRAIRGRKVAGLRWGRGTIPGEGSPTAGRFSSMGDALAGSGGGQPISMSGSGPVMREKFLSPTSHPTWRWRKKSSVFFRTHSAERRLKIHETARQFHQLLGSGFFEQGLIENF